MSGLPVLVPYPNQSATPCSVRGCWTAAAWFTVNPTVHLRRYYCDTDAGVQVRGQRAVKQQMDRVTGQPADAYTPPEDMVCGYRSPILGPCICGDAANHAPGGQFYKEGRLPESAQVAAVPVVTEPPDLSAFDPTYTTLTVTTESGTIYTVVKRPGFTVLVSNKGEIDKGETLTVVRGRMYLEADGDGVVLTSPIRSVYVMEN